MRYQTPNTSRLLTVALSLTILAVSPVASLEARETRASRSTERVVRNAARRGARQLAKTRSLRSARRAATRAARKTARREIASDVLGIDKEKIARDVTSDPAGSLRRLPGSIGQALRPESIDRYLRNRSKYVEDKYLRGGHIADGARDLDRFTGGRLGRGARKIDKLSGGHIGRGTGAVSRTYNKGVNHVAGASRKVYRGVRKHVARPAQQAYRAADKSIQQAGKQLSRGARRTHSFAKKAGKKVGSGVKKALRNFKIR